MDKDKKNRSGSLSNEGNSKPGDRGRTDLPGSPATSNRQTGDSKRREKDDSSRGAERNTTKKQGNSI